MPQRARQPATTEDARTPQLETTHFHLQAVDYIGGNLSIVRKQTQVCILLLLFIKHRQRLPPCRLLLVVDLAEIENGSLHRLVRSDAMVLDDAEAMVLAVFLAIVAAQKHADGRLPELRCQREDTWPSLYRFFQRATVKTGDLTTNRIAKSRKLTATGQLRSAKRHAGKY